MGCKGSKAKGSKAGSDEATEALLQDPENKTEEKADDTAAPKEASVEETATGTEPMLPDESAKEPATDEAQSAVDDPKQAALEAHNENEAEEVIAWDSTPLRERDECRIHSGQGDRASGDEKEAEAVEATNAETSAPEVEAEAVVHELVSPKGPVACALSEVSTAESINLALLEDSVRPINEDTDTPKEAVGGGGCFFCCGAKKEKETETETEKEKAKEKEKEKETEKEKEKETAKAKVKAKAKPKAKEKEKAKAKAKPKAKEKKIK